ncbi:MAG: FAD-dependent monooxygenase [Proteobacteria bacterium]|nr:FAD-dependent monooxygenase [Pseudomonadota bacterium]
MSDARVIVVGGGPAGLAIAGLLALEGVDTMLVAPPPVSFDPRTIALMQPALRLLQRLGVWPEALSASSSPLRHLSIRDETGNLFSAPALTFSASELGLESFGWNIPLADMVPRLVEAAQRLGARLLEGEVAAVEHGHHQATVVLVDGRRFTAPLLVAADGQNSVLRGAAGIDADRWSFDQAALVANFRHSGPHGDCSTERHRIGGPLTTVPLPGRHSSLVWMASPDRIERILENPSALASEIQLGTHGELGLVSDVTPPRSFAMRGLTARRFAASRTMLVGEAAHAFPPIGAQGLNMSLRDAGHVADVVMGHDDPGSEAALGDYHGRRVIDVNERQAAISLVNKSLIADLLPLHLLRAGGLSLIAAFPPLRNLVMRHGLAPDANLPFAMRA